MGNAPDGTVTKHNDAQALLPGRALTAGATREDRTVLVRGKGSRVWDAEGNEYIDYLLGSGPLVLGHAHPAVVEAVCKQAELGSTFYALNDRALELAATIADLVPCAEAVQFCGSGGEATHYALRLARAATGRDAVLKFDGGFHGFNDYGMMSLFPQAPPRTPYPEPSSAGVPRALELEVFVSPFNDLDAVSGILAEHHTRIAAIIVEPVQRAVAPVPGFLEGLRELTRRYGIVLIFDEVVTGFRLAPGGAQAFYGVTPDLAALGKIVGGGYPLAAVVGRTDILGLSAPGSPADGFVFINGTLNGNPVAAAAGLAAIRALDEDAYSRLHWLGTTLRDEIEQSLLSGGIASQVIGVGPLFQICITASDRELHDYRATREVDSATMSAINESVFHDGIFISGGRGYISLAHSDADIAATSAALAEAASEVASATESAG